MKKTQSTRGSIRPLIAGMLIATSAAATCSAASLIDYNFNTDAQGWRANGGGDVTWQATGGNTGGCLKLTYDGTTVMEVNPIVDVDVNTAEYLSIDFDIMVDVASGRALQGYGNLQVVLRDSNWSWDSMWYGAMGDQFAGNWQHMSFIIPRKDGVYKTEAHLGLQIGGADYNAPFIAYLDNVQIRPLPNPWVLNAFTSESEATAYGPQTWSRATASALNTTQDAGGGATPAGSAMLTCDFLANTWGQAVFQFNKDFDPSRFTYIEMDVKVDAATSTPMADGTYGYFEPIIHDSSWGWVSCVPTGAGIPASAATEWTHVKVALPNLTAAKALSLKLSGNASASQQGEETHVINLLVDNIKMSKPTTPPALKGLDPAGPGGVQITLNGAGDQWDRQALCVPANSAINYTWGSLTPASYSFTLTNFPSPASAPGMAAHIFIVNGDTFAPDQNASWNETYGGADWNSSDVAMLRVANGTNGGVVASFQWKTNSPASNAGTEASIELPLQSANGKWTLNFSDDRNGTIVGPSGTVVTNFTLPDGVQNQFTGPFVSFLQFGIFKNDGANHHMNDNKSAIISQVLVTNAYGVTFDDDFAEGLTAKYAWRVSNSQRVVYVPSGLAYWLKWTVPDADFHAEVAPAVTGPWTDANVTYIYTDSTGTNRMGGIPATSLPAGNQSYFRLIKPAGQ